MILFTLLGTTLLTAQETAFWIGGTPGQETNWHVARNWSNNQIPDEFTNVIIERANSGHSSQPVISASAEALSIKLYNSTLTVTTKGLVLINGSFSFSDGIDMINGTIDNNGTIELKDIAGEGINQLNMVRPGNGRLIVNGMDIQAQPPLAVK